MGKKSKPLTKDNAAGYLELALRFNAETTAQQAANFLATRPESFRNGGLFFDLSAESAAAVLHSDSLRISYTSAQEIEILALVNQWAVKNNANVAKVVLLLDAIRLDLFSFADITALEDKLEEL